MIASRDNRPLSSVEVVVSMKRPRSVFDDFLLAAPRPDLGEQIRFLCATPGMVATIAAATG
jgi:hypothetical protein